MYPYFDETVNIPGDDPHTPYVYYDERISLSINVALAISRPLLVTGSPGSGKSTLAEDAAKRLGWTFLSATFTSHTRFEDLVAKTDSVSRLADAQLQRLGRDSDYLVPGILWWAFDGESAEQLVDSQPEAHRTHDPRVRSVHDALGTRRGTVLLLDEIDKAEPDLPNDLLGPLGGDELRLPGGRSIQAPLTNTLVIITSNGERALPPAFLRRCVHLDLRTPPPRFCTRLLGLTTVPRTSISTKASQRAGPPSRRVGLATHGAHPQLQSISIPFSRASNWRKHQVARAGVSCRQ